MSIQFGWHYLSSNEKLILASMLWSLFPSGSQLSPEEGHSGTEMLETHSNCPASRTSSSCYRQLLGKLEYSPLWKIYKTYSDFALKNPGYLLEMPIRCELCNQNPKLALEVAEKAGSLGPISQTKSTMDPQILRDPEAGVLLFSLQRVWHCSNLEVYL
jgi:hypothetical protein